jgi:hypothetical protein
MASTTLTRAVKLTGTSLPEPKRRTLQAGPVTAMFDNGALRYIRYRGVEVLRGISYLVRDRNWGTYAPAIEQLKIKQAKDGFSISYSATCRDKAQAIRYDVTVTADNKGTLAFSAVATPLTDFLTNRTGFVVLHPLDGVVGRPVGILHTDGTTRRARFPKFISPGQPVFAIRALTHEVVPGVTATVLMEGNTFEMEDHRNWMDASYKTYVCSLLDPWPYTLKKGQPFTQTITMRITGRPTAKRATSSGSAVSVTVGKVKGRMPEIGAGVPMPEARAAVEQAGLIAAMEPSYLVCQIDGRNRHQATAAAAFRKLQALTDTPSMLEIVLPAEKPAEDEIRAIAAELARADYRPDAIVITQQHDLKSFQPNAPRPNGPSYVEMAKAARKAFPGVPIGGGMLSYFTELNRKPPPGGLFDFITHSLCPIVHAADDISVMETLESIPSIIASTRKLIGRAHYHLGPSAIGCRGNPYGAAATPNPNNERLCLAEMDPRQRGLFAAAWNVGLIAALAKGGLESVTLGAVTGPQGVIYRKMAHPQPGFDGTGAKVYPAYHVLAGLCPASGHQRRDTVVSAASTIAALAYQSGKGTELWLANLTASAQQVKVAGLRGPAEIHHLSEQTFAPLTREPDFLRRPGARIKTLSGMELGPYAVARIRTD